MHHRIAGPIGVGGCSSFACSEALQWLIPQVICTLNLAPGCVLSHQLGHLKLRDTDLIGRDRRIRLNYRRRLISRGKTESLARSIVSSLRDSMYRPQPTRHCLPGSRLYRPYGTRCTDLAYPALPCRVSRLCRPYGTRCTDLSLPGTPVPGSSVLGYVLSRAGLTRDLYRPQPTRHCRAGLQVVSSLRDSMYRPRPTRHSSRHLEHPSSRPCGTKLCFMMYPGLASWAKFVAVPAGLNFRS